LISQALLQTERQATETAKKEHAEAERRNEELMKKFEAAEKKIEQLQDTAQRCNPNKTTSYCCNFDLMFCLLRRMPPFILY
jgi:hypothetical protein